MVGYAPPPPVMVYPAPRVYYGAPAWRGPYWQGYGYRQYHHRDFDHGRGRWHGHR
jgi:hypothetical protein